MLTNAAGSVVYNQAFAMSAQGMTSLDVRTLLSGASIYDGMISVIPMADGLGNFPNLASDLITYYRGTSCGIASTSYQKSATS
ncbi:MAG: hypothetical protein IT292_12155 [Deltaproteobacteria bacterium]|nr:hypothetical protein [Deltaproteobacteria bacterium]